MVAQSRTKPSPNTLPETISSAAVIEESRNRMGLSFAALSLMSIMLIHTIRLTRTSRGLIGRMDQWEHACYPNRWMGTESQEV